MINIKDLKIGQVVYLVTDWYLENDAENDEKQYVGNCYINVTEERIFAVGETEEGFYFVLQSDSDQPVEYAVGFCKSYNLFLTYEEAKATAEKLAISHFVRLR